MRGGTDRLRRPETTPTVECPTIMRWTAFFLLALTAGGCTVQSSGQRCQQNSDCAETDGCRQELHPERDCNSATSCICCPTDPTAAQAYPGCVAVQRDSGVVTDNGVVTDRGTTPVTDNGVRPDTGTVVPADVSVPCTTNADCTIGNYCNGAACGGAGLCAPRPTSCVGVNEPVCGCDGVAYLNPCSAAQAGFRVRSTGSCSATPDAGTLPIDAGVTADAGTPPSDLGVRTDAGTPSAD